MRILIVHNAYQQYGGEDTVVANERALLEDGGFIVTRIVERRGMMRFADGSALLNHHFIKLGFLDAWKSVVAGREREVFRALIERLNELAGRKGELRLTIPMVYIEAVAR